MKKLLLVGMIVAAFALPALAMDKPAVPEGPLDMNLTKQPVVFNHATHTAYECESCHHPVEGVATYKPCATAGCHDVLDKKDKSVHSYYQIAHKMKGGKFASCISCHREVVAEKKKAGEDTKALNKQLTGCKGSGCHA